MQELPLSAGNVATITKQFESWSPQDIIAWAHGTFGADLVVTSSFGDPVLAHMTWSTVKGSTVTLIDTQYLFAQTLWYAKGLAEQTAGNLEVIAPAETVLPDDLWQRDTDACCAIRKVAPLEHALANKSAWLTGVVQIHHWLVMTCCAMSSRSIHSPTSHRATTTSIWKLTG